MTGQGEPMDFLDARLELEGPDSQDDGLTVERVDPSWVTAVARLSDGSIDSIAGRWIDLVEEELGMLPREEKPWIRQLAGQVVGFCRTADAAPDVLFAWSI